MNNVLEKFLSLVVHDTASDLNSDKTPSSEKQLTFAKEVLLKECQKAGLCDIKLDQFGYVTATLPSNIDKEVPVIGFIAHMDTSPDFNGKDVKPQIIKNYSGGDISLNETDVLSPKEFPDLNKYIGQDIVTTDGTTLLGADNKAGIAEILVAMEYLSNNPQVKHGKIRIAFTPDEEIGHGADHFDVEGFGADFAYTIDGGEVGQLECESFNAANASIVIKGKSVHPGSAKGIMINAALIASQFVEALPKDETPSTTDGYLGFYHLTDISGSVTHAKLEYKIRDFNKKLFEERKAFITQTAENLNKIYGDGIVTVNIRDEYYNMYEVLKDKEDIKNIAAKAYQALGITPIVTPIRGGTDGSRLSFMGLPCPNIFTGGHNFHGKYEYIPVQSMIKAVEVIVKICNI